MTHLHSIRRLVAAAEAISSNQQWGNHDDYVAVCELRASLDAVRVEALEAVVKAAQRVVENANVERLIQLRAALAGLTKETP